MFYPNAFFLTTVMGGAAGVKAMCLAIYSAKKRSLKRKNLTKNWIET